MWRGRERPREGRRRGERAGCSALFWVGTGNALRSDLERLEDLEIDSPKAGPRVFEALRPHFDHCYRLRG